MSKEKIKKLLLKKETERKKAVSLKAAKREKAIKKGG
jgi:hypothetical protein